MYSYFKYSQLNHQSSIATTTQSSWYYPAHEVDGPLRVDELPVLFKDSPPGSISGAIESACASCHIDVGDGMQEARVRGWHRVGSSPVNGAGIELGGRSRSPSSPALLTTQRNPSSEHAWNAASARRSATTKAGGSRRSAFRPRQEQQPGRPSESAGKKGSSGDMHTLRIRRKHGYEIRHLCRTK